MEFISVECDYVHGGTTVMRTRPPYIIDCATVVGLMKLDDNRCHATLISDFTAPIDQTATCWFMIDCTNTSGATFNVCTNGEEYYYTTRVTNPDLKNSLCLKLHSEMRGSKQTLKGAKLTTADQHMINYTISIWTGMVRNGK